MNKGLFIHLIVTLSAVVLWVFIVGSEDWSIDLRAGAAFTIFILNFIVLCMISNAFTDFKGYSEKIKL